jgi:hypothetical protein
LSSVSFKLSTFSKAGGIKELKNFPNNDFARVPDYSLFTSKRTDMSTHLEVFTNFYLFPSSPGLLSSSALPLLRPPEIKPSIPTFD